MILPLSVESVRHVARNMRESDRREIFATRWNEDPDELARGVAAAPIGAVFATLRRPVEAVAVVVAFEAWPHVHTAGLFATRRWHEVALQTLRWIKLEMMPLMWAQGAIRVECHSIADHHQAHRLLRHLGRTREDPVPCFGKNGENFIRFAWTRDAFVLPRWWSPAIQEARACA